MSLRRRLGILVFLGLPLSGWATVLIRESAIAVVADLDWLALGLFGATLVVTLTVILKGAPSLRKISLPVAAIGLLGVGFLLWLHWGLVQTEEVSFASGGIELRGTIYQPRRPGRSPGAVLVHGSGRVPRAEHRFHARFLAERGIAALAYDKRGTGQSGGDTYDSTYLDYAQDVAAAVECLARSSVVDPRQLGLVGFSEAEWVAPVTENNSDKISFIVMIGPGGLPPAEQVEEEIRLRLESKGFSEPDVRKAVDLQRLYSDYLRERVSPAELASRLERESNAAWFAAAEDIPGHVYPRNDFSWWLRVMDFDASGYWSRVNVPVLLLKGAEDDRSAAEPSMERISGQLTRPVDVVVYPEADHMLLRWPLGKAIPPPVFARGYPEVIAKWIWQVVTSPSEKGQESGIAEISP